MTTVTLEGTQELMKAREVSVILATGGMGLVRAAYSAGKPAYGVGPGNAPCYIESSADFARPPATSSLASRSTTACSARRRTPWSSIEAVEAKRAGSSRQGGYFLYGGRSRRAGEALVTPQRLPNPALVGKSAIFIARRSASRCRRARAR